MTEEREERHIVEMMGGKRPTNEGAAIYPHITCESGAEVQVSQVIGGLIQSIDAAGISELNFLKGPLFVNCAKHGGYLGFVQILSRGPNLGAGEGQEAVSMPVVLIPLNGLEYVLPESMR